MDDDPSRIVREDVARCDERNKEKARMMKSIGYPDAIIAKAITMTQYCDSLSLEDARTDANDRYNEISSCESSTDIINGSDHVAPLEGIMSSQSIHSDICYDLQRLSSLCDESYSDLRHKLLILHQKCVTLLEASLTSDVIVQTLQTDVYQLTDDYPACVDDELSTFISLLAKRRMNDKKDRDISEANDSMASTQDMTMNMETTVPRNEAKLSSSLISGVVDEYEEVKQRVKSLNEMLEAVQSMNGPKGSREASQSIASAVKGVDPSILVDLRLKSVYDSVAMPSNSQSMEALMKSFRRKDCLSPNQSACVIPLTMKKHLYGKIYPSILVLQPILEASYD